MQRHRWQVIAGLTLCVCALIAAGCGDDDETTSSTTTSGSSSDAEQSIDAAVKSCSDEAEKLGGTAGTALSSACTSVGSAAKQAASEGGSKAEAALAKAESTCKSAVSDLPSGQAQDALSKLCDAISSAE